MTKGNKGGSTPIQKPAQDEKRNLGDLAKTTVSFDRPPPEPKPKKD